MKENRNQKRNQKADFFSLVNPASNRLSGFDFYQLNEYASIIDWTTRVLAILPVLFIYSQNQTATMKVPWIILILAFPILGVALYFLVGLNGGTKKMKRRYDKVDEKLFKYVGKGVKNPDGRGISEYIHKYSGYPVYENTEVKYFDEAINGHDSQLHDLALAKDFIFMEYTQSRTSKPGKRSRRFWKNASRQALMFAFFMTIWDRLCSSTCRLPKNSKQSESSVAFFIRCQGSTCS